MKFVILVLIISFVACGSCKKHIVFNDSTFNKCIFEDDSTVIVHPCILNRYCNKSSELCEDNPWAGKMYPGEYCSSNEDCISKECINSHCYGYPIGKECSDTKDCINGAYCEKDFTKSTGICTPVIRLGGSCRNDHVCAANLVCNFGKCVRYGILPDGSEADNFFACRSFYTDMHCTEAPRLIRTDGKRDGPVLCPADKKCKYTKDNFDASCKCSINGEAKEYCTPGHGDYDLGHYSEFFDSIDENDHVLCAPVCINKEYSNMSAEFHEYVIGMYKVKNLTYNIIDPIIERTFHIRYYLSKKAYKKKKDKKSRTDENTILWIIVAGLVAGFIIAVILIFYFRNKHLKEDSIKEKFINFGEVQ